MPPTPLPPVAALLAPLPAVRQIFGSKQNWSVSERQCTCYRNYYRARWNFRIKILQSTHLPALSKNAPLFLCLWCYRVTSQIAHVPFRSAVEIFSAQSKWIVAFERIYKLYWILYQHFLNKNIFNLEKPIWTSVHRCPDVCYDGVTFKVPYFKKLLIDIFL